MNLSTPDVALTIWQHFVEDRMRELPDEEVGAALKNGVWLVGEVGAKQLEVNPVFVPVSPPPAPPAPDQPPRLLTRIGSIFGFTVLRVEGLP